MKYNISNEIPSKKTLIGGKIYDGFNKFWELEEGDEPSKLFNAIEIDWNGAEVEDGITINTTDELLEWINNKNNIQDIQINGESKGNTGVIDLGNYLTEHPENGEKFLSFGSINDNVKRILVGLSIDKNGHIVYGKEISIQSLAQEVAKYITIQNNNIYMISFKDGDEIISNVSGITGTSITIPQNPTKEGYEFVGWNRDINAIEAEDVINQIGNANITYYAIWKEKELLYYWYIGNVNDPMPTSISPIVTDNTSVGWRLIGPTLESGQQIWNETYEIQISNENKVYQRIIINSDNVDLVFYDSLGNTAEFVNEKEIINGWTVYTTISKSKTFSIITEIQ